MQPVTLRTDRLVLSVPTDADVGAIHAACQDPEVPRWTTLPSPYEQRHAQEFVAKAAQWWAEQSELTWAIRTPAGFAGMMGLHRVELGGAAEIGYWMAAPARGQGLLTEAARAAIDFGFSLDGLALQRIEWRAVVGNVPSARVARRLGFRYEGMLRQALSSPRGRDDGWVAGLLHTDDRTPQPWEILPD